MRVCLCTCAVHARIPGCKEKKTRAQCARVDETYLLPSLEEYFLKVSSDCQSRLSSRRTGLRPDTLKETCGLLH